MKLYALILLMVVVTVFADYLLKLASQRSGWMYSVEFAAGATLYGLTAAGWVVAMRHMTLAGLGVAYSILMMLLLAGLGVIAFRESLTGRDVLGLVLAVAALGLMNRS